MLRRFTYPLVLAALIAPSTALAASDSNVAALQVRLRALKLYTGPVSGVQDDATIAALLAPQQRAGIVADGVVRPKTRQVLGTWAQRTLGSRTLGRGNIGWDVAALQFALTWHGFPSGMFAGVYESHVQAAVRRPGIGGTPGDRRAWHESPLFNERERAAMSFTDAVTLIADGHVSREVWDEATATFDSTELAHLVWAITAINAWNRIAVTTRMLPSAVGERSGR